MKKTILAILLAIFLLPCVCFGAATVAVSGYFVSITSIDADWLWSTTFSGRPCIYVDWIAFEPGAASDQCVIFDQAVASGVEIFPTGESADTTDGRIIYYQGDCISPVVDYSAGTFSANHKLIIKLAQ